MLAKPVLESGKLDPSKTLGTDSNTVEGRAPYDEIREVFSGG